MYETIQACQLVGIDRQRFNEFVASGEYPCAPALVGRGRTFKFVDLIALSVFVRELRAKTRPAIAGELAASALATLHNNSYAEVCASARLATGGGWISVPADWGVDELWNGTWIVSLVRHNLGQIRKNLIELLAPDDGEGEFLGE